MKKNLLFTLLASVIMTAAVSVMSFAADLTADVVRGDTGKTAQWKNPATGESMIIPVATPEAWVIFTGSGSQPTTAYYNVDGSVFSYDGWMGDFSIYHKQDMDIRESVDAISRMDGVAFPENFIYFLDTNGEAPYCAIWISSNPEALSSATEPAEVIMVPEGWQEDSKGRWFRFSNGSWPSDMTLFLDGKTYYFKSDGYLLTNSAVTIGNEIYKAGSDGALTRQ